MADKNPVEKSFQASTRLIFGKPLSGIEKYEQWLLENMPPIRIVSASDTGKKLLLPSYIITKSIPEDRIIGWESFEKAGMEKISSPSSNFKELAAQASKIALFCCEYKEGECHDNLESNFYLNLSNSYHTVDTFFAKNCGCEVYDSFTEGSFGCFLCLYSKFVVNCYFSKNLNMCFEMDSCHSCRGSMFCHNCENVNDSMFCFNAKNLTYAIGNAVVGKEKFMAVKTMACHEILATLEKKGRLGIGIYSLGSLAKMHAEGQA